MNTCSICGRRSRARRPRTLVSIGTLRQPISCRPAARISRFMFSRAASARTGSWLKKTMPTAYWAGSSTEKVSLAMARRKRSGFWINRPQPSPVLPSALMPPRWVMQVRASMAVLRRWWLASPCIWAIKPKPQLSLNSSGWYRPAFIGELSPGLPLDKGRIAL
ncbi:hypothetical protein D9M72_237690 [compost metagenome]